MLPQSFLRRVSLRVQRTNRQTSRECRRRQQRGDHRRMGWASPCRLWFQQASQHAACSMARPWQDPGKKHMGSAMQFRVSAQAAFSAATTTVPIPRAAGVDHLHVRQRPLHGFAEHLKTDYRSQCHRVVQERGVWLPEDNARPRSEGATGLGVDYTAWLQSGHVGRLVTERNRSVFQKIVQSKSGPRQIMAQRKPRC
jgi:hypothetical protein